MMERGRHLIKLGQEMSRHLQPQDLLHLSMETGICLNEQDEQFKLCVQDISEIIL